MNELLYRILNEITKAKKISLNPGELTKRTGDYRIGLNKAYEIVIGELRDDESQQLDVISRIEMRKHAISVLELTKGFTSEPTDAAMKTALEMADYVMLLTNNLD